MTVDSIIQRYGRSNVITRALREGAAVVLTGLPRVGRSNLASEFCKNTSAQSLIVDASVADDRDRLASLLSSSEKTQLLIVIDNLDDTAIDIAAALIRKFDPLSARQSSELTSKLQFLLLPKYQWIEEKLREELIGFTRFVELPPIQPNEAFNGLGLATKATGPLIDVSLLPAASSARNSWRQDIHWLRGGFPLSLLAVDDDRSFRWREDYLDVLFKRRHHKWNIEPADRLSEVFARLVKGQGQQFDEVKCRSDLKIDKNQLGRVLYFLKSVGLVRQLDNWIENGLSIIQVRDSGLFHAAAGIRTIDNLKEDSLLYGHSWECFAAETLIVANSDKARPYFFRKKEGDEIDLVLDFRSRTDRLIAIEFKTNDKESVKPGFWRACKELKPTHKFVVHSGSSNKREDGVEHISLAEAVELLTV